MTSFVSKYLSSLNAGDTITSELYEYITNKASTKDETISSLFQALEWSANEAAFLERINELFISEIRTFSSLSTGSSQQLKPKPSNIIVPLKRSIKYLASLKRNQEVSPKKKGCIQGFLKKVRVRKFTFEEESLSEEESIVHKKNVLMNNNKSFNETETEMEVQQFKERLHVEASTDEINKKYEEVFEREKEAAEEINEDLYDDEIMVDCKFNGEEETPIIDRGFRV